MTSFHASRPCGAGLECDVGICAGTALFKSAVLGLLAHVSRPPYLYYNIL